MSGGPFLYPNVTSLPGSGGLGQTERLPKHDGAKGEFDKVFDKELGKAGQLQDSQNPQAPSGLDQLKQPLKFSAHASQRLKERKISLDPAMMSKINDAVDKADAKGLDDTLVLTNDAALIVSVRNRTVITALDKSQMTGNVFTNIDGAVII